MAHCLIWILPSYICSKVTLTHLQKVLKVASSKLLHLWSIVCKSSDRRYPECGHAPKPGSRTLVTVFELQAKNNYLESSSVTFSVPFDNEYRSRMRCLNSVFQTPSSNSWRKSTTSNFESSKFAIPRRSIKAFYRNGINSNSIDRNRFLITSVGTDEDSFNKFSTWTPLIGCPML